MQMLTSEWDSIWAEFDARTGQAIRQQVEAKTAEQAASRPSRTVLEPASTRRVRPMTAYILGLLTSLTVAPVAVVLGLTFVVPGPLPSGAAAMTRAELQETARSLVRLTEVSPDAAQWAASLHPDFGSPRAAQQLVALARPNWVRLVAEGPATFLTP